MRSKNTAKMIVQDFTDVIGVIDLLFTFSSFIELLFVDLEML